SMEVDDPNEQIKEKEANKEKESEKNGNEKKVENEKEKQYEADKTKDMFKWKKENGKCDEEKQFEAFAKTIKIAKPFHWEVVHGMPENPYGVALSLAVT
nr:hypothetical protein [Tanacetum cinerariifolium]